MILKAAFLALHCEKIPFRFDIQKQSQKQQELLLWHLYSQVKAGVPSKLIEFLFKLPIFALLSQTWPKNAIIAAHFAERSGG